ncbi:MAG: hypothetical protein CVV49_13030 [Spirochaetae bacterium HGW-Spirochaetae-5]|nr:MAG: hypothetical protein CVV49_13030 [Spirochaetae bacterium HGW-Spirochaetae-5]
MKDMKQETGEDVAGNMREYHKFMIQSCFDYTWGFPVEYKYTMRRSSSCRINRVMRRSRIPAASFSVF